MKMTTIKFVADYKIYHVGEIAGFMPEHAQILIRRGYAVEYKGQASADAARVRSALGAPQTRHIPGPPNTAAGAPAVIRKCGKCGKPGHTRTNCIKK